MRFTDIFIRRPVLATVISLLILLLGLRAVDLLNVRQYPRTENTVITVTTAYVGASAELVRGFITTLLEKEIASADGIDYLESTSLQGMSQIRAHLLLNYDPNAALTQITSKVNKVRSDLPEGSEDPVFNVTTGETTAAMYMSFFSDVLQSNQITDYLIRVVRPKLETVSGVQEAEILGARTFAMRLWLEPEKMAALGITAGDVREVLLRNNFLSAAGRTKGNMIAVDLTASTEAHSAEDFRRLVVKEDANTIVRLGDIATVALGAENYDSSVIFNGENATFIGIRVAPTANPLTVIQEVRDIFPDIKSQFPRGLTGKIVYDATRYIEESITEVVRTLAEALAIVVVVIFLFLGSVRSVAVPVVAIPLSLVGAAFLMLLAGFSINLLTLLAMVLAIGLVVDDAIVVAENIHRHIEEGQPPREAALRGARELGSPIIAMTLTLVAVYAPIGFVGGLTGSLFTEFAFTLAGAVLISGVVALTLSPMMCSKLLRPETGRRGFAHTLDVAFDRLRLFYERRLHGVLDYGPVTLFFAAAVLASCYFLYATAQTELAPDEDQGVVFVQSTAAPNASIGQLELYTRELTGIYEGFPEMANYFLLNGVGGGGAPATTNTAFSGMVLEPWAARERSVMEIQPVLQKKVEGIAGLQSVAFNRPPLPGAAGGLPVQFVIGSIESPRAINEVSQEMLRRARESGLFAFVDTDLKYDKPQLSVEIDRDKAAAVGLDMRDIGGDLAVMLGGNFVNRFSLQGRSYKVIPQAERLFRLNPDLLERFQVRTESGGLIPLSTLVSLETTVEPEQLKRFQQLNAATLSAVPVRGVSLGEALEYLESVAAEIFPRGYTVDYAGQSRQYVQEGATLVITFLFAIVIIFLVLAAQFESFRDPLVILVSVPLSISGALIFLSLGVATVNIYTQVGLITLIGLISKHGILIVQFANQLQAEEGLDKRAAVEKASGIRLRPILMTTAAMVFGVVPLLLASGAGAQSRFDIGLVVATGLSIGTLFTLFVVPTFYAYLAPDLAAGGARRAAEAGPAGAE